MKSRGGADAHIFCFCAAVRRVVHPTLDCGAELDSGPLRRHTGIARSDLVSTAAGR